MSTRVYIPDTLAINNLVAADCQENPGTMAIGRNVLEVSQAIFLFDISSLLGLADIDTANLFMQIHSQVDSGLNKAIGVYKIIQNWLPTPNCPASPPLIDPTPIAVYNVTSGVVDINMDVKSIVEEWIIDPQRNFGLLVKVVDELIPLTAFRIYSLGYSNSSRWPYIEINMEPMPLEIKGSLDPVIDYKTDLPVITGDSYAYSTTRQFAKAFFSTFFIKNEGTKDALVKLQISSDDVSYIDDSLEIIVAAGEEVTLIPQTYGNYNRVAYKSYNLSQATILSINYIEKVQ